LIEIDKYKQKYVDFEKQIEDLLAKEISEENIQKMFMDTKKLADAK